MIFEQFFDPESSTYTYLVARRPGAEALLIDPVDVSVDAYLEAIERHDLRLVQAVDTHVHADHVTGLGALRDATGCVTTMGEQSKASCVSRTVSDGETLDVDGLKLEALYTPGHTDDSYCFRMDDRVFTGDTLLINGTGRTDFQNGDARAQYDSIFNVLLKLPDETKVYPAHDYRGNTVSTIGEQRASNPRLQVKNADEYAALMAGLNLPNPKMMDVAVPANLACGSRDRAATPEAPPPGMKRTSARAVDPSRYRIIDVRSAEEFTSELGHIEGAELYPVDGIATSARSWGRKQPLLMVCRSGGRSARAAQTLLAMGFEDITNLEGGMLQWARVGRPSVR
jgi:glyoxylase-like metal-dependent hydrolase (beta-lactamase superfamily II)/rhodanese-related sulfurtransferase